MTRAWQLLTAGAVCGLAWASALRGFMVEVAGAESKVEWFGTFEGILLPGAVAGLLLGWAEHLRRTGGRPHWRWLALAPLAFVVATPTVLVSIFTDGGIGGGAVAVPLFGMAGGYALSGRGRVLGRALTGAFALVPFVGAAVVGVLSPVDPRAAWTAVLFLSLLAVLSLACAIPHRKIAQSESVDPELDHVHAVPEGPK